MFRRHKYDLLRKRLQEPRRFLQVLIGPRQVGKTTMARQLMEDLDLPSHYATADEPGLKGLEWLEQQWEVGRSLALSENGHKKPALLVLDEIQKIPDWSETIKRLWDEDSARRLPLRVLLLGSSALLVKRGLSESLAGRFEVIRLMHWSYGEMREAFGIDLESYLYFGGYPAAVSLIGDPERWTQYILDSLIEPAIARDILLMTRVDKPALLRRLFELGCAWSGRVLSYQKLLGQLHDAGNTTTLAHYLNLLETAGLLAGLQKYAGQKVRRRASSPKFLALNTALMTAFSGTALENNVDRKDDFHGRLVETAVGAYLYNSFVGTGTQLYYWSARNAELDFVLSQRDKLIAIEVKSGTRQRPLPGLTMFCKKYQVTKKLLVGGDGFPLEDFLLTSPSRWLE